MKWKISNRVQVGAHEYRIVRDDKELALLDYWGLLSQGRSKIIIGSQPTISQQLETLIHELLHLSLRTFGHIASEKKEEQLVRLIGAGLAQALLSMGLEPDFRNIVEEK